MSSPMSPEAKLAQYAERIHLQDEDVDYLLSLVQQARGLGSLAGAAAEREACAMLAESFIVESEHLVQLTAREIATAIRARGAS